MIDLFAIELDAAWVCEYFELRPDLYEFAKDVAVPSLEAWSFDKLRVENWAAYLRRPFVLTPTAACVRYFLYIDSAPCGTRIYINNRALIEYQPPGLDDPPFELDVTDHVHLDRNEIGFRVMWDAPGRFSRVRLQPVGCR
jgi:hypothetical protein